MANTPVYSLPYPTNDDGPYGPAQIQALAEATEAELVRIDEDVANLQDQVTTGIDAWHSVSFASGWGNTAGDQVARYKMVPGNFVVLQGLVSRTGPDAAANTTMCTLPEGYRPTEAIRFPSNISTGTSTSVRVLPTGEVRALTAVNTGQFVALDLLIPLD